MGKYFFLAILFSMSNYLFSFEISEYPYKSKFEKRFKQINDINTIMYSLDDKDPDMVFCALKKVGELKITNARQKVEGLADAYNPQANLGKELQVANFRHLFYMSILVLGKIGNDTDGNILGGYLWDLKKDKLGTTYTLSALGDLTNSSTALKILNDYVPSIVSESDSRVARQLVDSLLLHNSRSSIVPLINIKQKVSQLNQAYINEAIKILNQSAKDR